MFIYTVELDGLMFQEYVLIKKRKGNLHSIRTMYTLKDTETYDSAQLDISYNWFPQRLYTKNLKSR